MQMYITSIYYFPLTLFPTSSPRTTIGHRWCVWIRCWSGPTTTSGTISTWTTCPTAVYTTGAIPQLAIAPTRFPIPICDFVPSPSAITVIATPPATVMRPIREAIDPLGSWRIPAWNVPVACPGNSIYEEPVKSPPAKLMKPCACRVAVVQLLYSLNSR